MSNQSASLPQDYQQAILEASNELVITFSLDQDLRYANKTAQVMLEINDSKNLKNTSIRDLHSAEAYQLLKESILPRVVASNKPWLGEH